MAQSLKHLLNMCPPSLRRLYLWWTACMVCCLWDLDLHLWQGYLGAPTGAPPMCLTVR